MNYNYKCIVSKNGKRYYKNVRGKWKRISNAVGMKAEKCKKKYEVPSGTTGPNDNLFSYEVFQAMGDCSDLGPEHRGLLACVSRTARDTMNRELPDPEESKEYRDYIKEKIIAQIASMAIERFHRYIHIG